MSEKKETLTKEELQERKTEIEKFHKEQIPFLTQQLKYEKLLTDIEESRATRAMAMMRVAQIMAGPEKPEDNPSKEPTLPRTLKKD